MAELKAVHEKIDEIPEPYRELYTEKGGKYELTGILGVKTAADVERVQAALLREREDHKAARARLQAWGDLEPDDVLPKLDRLPELEAAAKGKLNEAEIEEIVERRLQGTLRSKLAPLERQLNLTSKERDELAARAKELTAKETLRVIRDHTREALVALKALPEAHEDAYILAERVFEVGEDGRAVTRDGVGVTPGLSPAEWLAEIREKRPHWWPENKGGNARGSGPSGFAGGANPWSADAWNLTAQGAFVKAHGVAKAEQAAKAAGTTLGGMRPAAKAAR